jgi:5-methylcytosine-specific restriction endonuclease McrA
MQYLPDSQDVDSNALARAFTDVTTSYKFLYFLALLDNAERIAFDSSTPISLKEIATDMLVVAWFPHIYFRLSFGKQDRVAAHLDKLTQRSSMQNEKMHPWDKVAIRNLITSAVSQSEFTALTSDLMRFVPYRFIRPFFPDAAAIPDSKVNNRVAELAEQYFVARQPPYRFDSNRENIFLHPLWSTYFLKNLPFVRAWAWWHFLQYMQRCNPNVPAVASKLFAPPERESLAAQTKFWSAAIELQSFHCIYSGALITAHDFALDHFVPWSFVVHNQLWNLIPTTKTVNSKKSDNLPSVEKYLDSFVDAQLEAIAVTRNRMSLKSWQDYVSCFVADLGMPDYDSLLDREILRSGYDKNVRPLLQLAEANGFNPAWTHSSVS